MKSVHLPDSVRTEELYSWAVGIVKSRSVILDGQVAHTWLHVHIYAFQTIRLSTMLCYILLQENELHCSLFSLALPTWLLQSTPLRGHLTSPSIPFYRKHTNNGTPSFSPLFFLLSFVPSPSLLPLQHSRSPFSPAWTTWTLILCPPQSRIHPLLAYSVAR